jgi:hypothetical protein
VIVNAGSTFQKSSKRKFKTGSMTMSLYYEINFLSDFGNVINILTVNKVEHR